MPPEELMARVRLAVRRGLSWGFWTAGLDGNTHLGATPEPVADLFPPCSPSSLQAFLKRTGGFDVLLGNAEDVCAGRIEPFPQWQHCWDTLPDWHFTCPDPGGWTQGHFSRVRPGAGNHVRVADVKYTWELNRHQYLCILARAYAVTGQVRYARVAAEHLAHWIAANPYPTGINWASALEVSVRAIAWLWLRHCLRGSHPLKRIGPRFLSVLYQHGHYLDVFCTDGLNPSNHVIGEACGLLCLGTFFRGRGASARWRARGQGLLEKHILLQTFPTGESREQSVWYHRFVTDFFTLAYVVGQRAGLTFSAHYRERLLAMHRTLAGLTENDGTMPNVGDADQGRAYHMTGSARDDARPTLSTGAQIFGPQQLRWSVAALDEETLWLLGDQAVHGVEGRKRVSRGVGSSVQVGGNGWVTLRRHGPVKTRLLFDAGPQGIGNAAPHGHADALSLILRVGDKDVIVDPGTYAYNLGRQWRNFFRGTRAHNTVLVDGLDQAEPAFTFRWGQPADAKIECVEHGQGLDYVLGTHPAYERLPDPVTHKRHILSLWGVCVVVLDELVAAHEHHYTSLLHFAPGCALDFDEGCLAVGLGGESLVSVLPLGAGESSILQGETGPVQGWYSPSYGVKVPAPVFQYQWRSTGPCLRAMVLVPSGARQESHPKVRRRGPATAEVSVGDLRASVALRPDGEACWEIRGCRSDADALVVIEGPGLRSSVALNASAIVLGSSRVDCPTRRPCLQLTLTPQRPCTSCS